MYMSSNMKSNVNTLNISTKINNIKDKQNIGSFKDYFK